MSDLGYSILPYPPARQFFADGLAFAGRPHAMHGLIEVDVSAARQRLAQLKAGGEDAPTFTAFVAYCTAQAVGLDPRVQAYRDWRGRLIVFDDVDLFVPVERVRPDGRVGEHFTQVIIRSANKKTLHEIQAELRAAKSGPSGPGGDSFIRRFTALPRFVRHAFFAYITGRPSLMKKFTGTVELTNVGMFGRGAGWGVAPVGHSLSVTVGGIVLRPCVDGGRGAAGGGALTEHEHVCLTVTLDHEVIDGGPAARFIVKLKELLETAAGLAEW